MLVSARFRSYQARPRLLLVTDDPVHRKEIPSIYRRVLNCRQTGIRSPTDLAPAPAGLAPTAARKFAPALEYLPVQDRLARARAIRPVELMLGPRRVSLSVRVAWPSPENFSATRADRNATGLSLGGQHRNRGVPATSRKTPGSDPVLLRGYNRFVSRIRR